MARGEKGRRRPWREKKPSVNDQAQNGYPTKRPGVGRGGAPKGKQHLREADEFDDVPDFSDLSDNDIDILNAGPASRDADSIKDDVAKFAANLGLAVEGFTASGFDDRDFRKPPKKPDAKEDKQSKKEKGKASGKGDQDKGKGSQAQKQAGKKEWSADGEGADKVSAKKNKKVAEKVAIPTTPSEQESDEQNAFVPVESFFNAGGGGVEDVPMGPWYEQAAALSATLLPPAVEPAADTSKIKSKKSKKKQPVPDANVPAAPSKAWGSWDELVQKMKVKGEELLAQAAETYERGQGKSGKDVQWLVRARKTGTSADKVAAMTVMLQEDPAANVRSLDALLGELLQHTLCLVQEACLTPTTLVVGMKDSRLLLSIYAMGAEI